MYHSVALLIPILVLQQVCCAPQPPSNEIGQPYCVSDTAKWGDIDLPMGCALAIAEMRGNDPEIPKYSLETREFLASTGEASGRWTAMRTPRRYTYGQCGT